MRKSLDKTLRNQLEKVVVRARELIEKAASEALIRLGVETAEAPGYLNNNERKLRNRLRAHARQLGDKLQSNGVQGTERLRAEVSYEHWHRMLFARFLEQNNLLMLDKYLAVTLSDCQEYAEEEGCKDGWELAGKLAQRMLPQVFRVDSPVFELQIPVDRIRELEDLILTLPGAVFQAQDSLGWCYQFWQSKRKKEVNAAGIPIGADELSPVTQLFTEPYMVSFLLDNSLGAWWAKKQLTDADLRSASDEKTLRQAAAIDGVPLEYLRFVKTSDEQGELWQAAGGWFDGWPQEVRALKTLDPCCGSGHFLVALFLMLVPMRMQLEGLDARSAVDKVLADNLHGLELDSRCVEIAAFALALEAWRYPNAGGYRTLPALNIACSGLDVSAATQEWLALAKHNPDISEALNWFTRTFKDAPVLGSLIDVNTAYYEGKTEGKASPWNVLLEFQAATDDEEKSAQVTAQGLAMAAELLSKHYSLVVTNVPYLKAGDQCDVLKKFCEKYYTESKFALETTFMERCQEFLTPEGTSAIVTQQYWLFLKYYQSLRDKWLTRKFLKLIARVGTGAFQEVGGEVVNVCLQISGNSTSENCIGIEFEKYFNLDQKIKHLKHGGAIEKKQEEQRVNPDFRISFENILRTGLIMSDICDFGKGSVTGDGFHYLRCFWELFEPFKIGKYWLNSPDSSMYSGRSEIILWDQGVFDPTRELGFRHHGQRVFGKKGVAIGKAGKFRFTPYTGELFDDNTVILCPNDESFIPSLWEYCISGELQNDISKLDKKMSVTAGTFTKTYFDINYWNEKSTSLIPNGLPKPYTNDPTQWIFHGHPCGSVVWDENKKWTSIADKRTDETVLQVAVARLLGYRWPAELDDKMELADEMLHWLGKSDELLKLVDDDGIVCLPALRGEKVAASRLEGMLQAAYEEDWSSSVLSDLLASVGSKSLETWLRDKFFEQHCKLFQHRPFIWQIWDGLKDGFSVLVNYHKLNYQGLERLIYTYLGDWIRTQEHGFKEGLDGAESRLMAAKNLKDSLEAILKGDAITGKSGLDIFVRWKPLHEQPMGWNPDLDDGVRLNIRPFMQAPDVDKKGAGVLRTKPNIKWGKDRGNDVESAPWYYLGLQYGEKEGARINDHHISLADKQAARDEHANKENHG